MGCSWNAVEWETDRATFTVPKGVRYIGEQYVCQAPRVAHPATDIMYFELAMSDSETTIEHTRDAVMAAAQRDGFRSPVIQGNRFFFKRPLRSIATQKDWVGWIVPGTGVVVVLRNAHRPVASSAQRLLDRLTAT